MVSVIYNGDDAINFKCDGISPKFGIMKGSVIENIPQEVYDRDLKENKDFTLLTEKADQNKMEKSTKGAKQ